MLYIHLRDALGHKVYDARAFTNSLWERTIGYVDPDIQKKAEEQFHPRFWEMYLAATLLEQGLPVMGRERRRFRTKGPDVQIGNLDAWLEATAVTPGTGSNTVQEFDPESRIAINMLDIQDKVKLRLTSAIYDKHKKYQTYKKNGIVKEGEPFVIAVNSALISPIQTVELTVPLIIRTVFPFGHEVLQFNVDTKKVIDQYHNYQGSILKKEGSLILTTFFEQPESRGISAILHSNAHAFAYRKLGGDFKLIHNPQATAPLPKGFLKVGTEYRVEGDQICCQEYSQ